ncbi:MAG: urease accessory protein UreD [Stappiaceae bacterium]
MSVRNSTSAENSKETLPPCSVDTHEKSTLNSAGALNLIMGPHRPQRVLGRAIVAYHCRDNKTVLKDLGQSGSAKIKLPKTYDGLPLAVFLNTAGGITGGDELTYQAHIGKHCHAVISTQAAERIYRSQHGVGTVTNDLTVDSHGSCAWLPQETILFEKSKLRRRFSVNLGAGSDLIAVESVVLGRKAMGETIKTISFHDSWRIHRDGHLIFADDTRLSGDISELMAGQATAGGAQAFATLIATGPASEGKLGQMRTLIADIEGDAGASLIGDVLVARLVAPNGDILRRNLITILTQLRGRELPRVWHC